MTSEVPTLTAPLAVAARIHWRAAAVTAFAAVLFGRLNAALYDNERIYQLDREAAVLIPIVVAVALALFAVVSSRALRASAKTNSPARAALVCGILAPLSLVIFWLSLPIILGGLALTLGSEGLKRSQAEGGRRRALAAMALGALAAAANAVFWLVMA
jgi:hypothetical protein